MLAPLAAPCAFSAVLKAYRVIAVRLPQRQQAALSGGRWAGGRAVGGAQAPDAARHAYLAGSQLYNNSASGQRALCSLPPAMRNMWAGCQRTRAPTRPAGFPASSVLYSIVSGIILDIYERLLGAA